MQNAPLIFEQSVFWLIPSAILAGLAAWFMYAKPGPWGVRIGIVLAVIRFFILWAISFLLLNPFANLVNWRTETPKVAIVIDNSLSMIRSGDSVDVRTFPALFNEKAAQLPVELVWYDLNGKTGLAETGSFEQPYTDITSAIRLVEEDLAGENLSAYLLVSDGIVNRGLSLAYLRVFQPVYTIGVGDTTAQSDVAIVDVRSNAIVYQGNKFPVEVYIREKGFAGEQVKVDLKQGNAIIASKEIEITGNARIDFQVEAKTAGLKRFEVVLTVAVDEQITSNNQMDFYVEVIEAKETVLIVAPAPHPDIAAIRSALSASENYESFVYIPGLKTEMPDQPIDVVIWHQAFSRRFQLPQIPGDPAFWYITQAGNDFRNLADATGVKLEQSGSQKDIVRPAINPLFSKFKISDRASTVLRNIPSIEVPYGQYTLAGPTETLLFQQVGSVVTEKPLWSFYDNGTLRSAVVFGTGIWKWRLQELGLHEKSEIFDQLVQNTVKYLSIRNDRKRLVARPVQQVFQSFEQVGFKVETYNDVFERVGGIQVDLTLSDESGEQRSFQVNTDAFTSVFAFGQLPEGIYKYEAKATVGGQNFTEKGEFLVKKVQLENLVTQANHQVLRDISNRTGGEFFTLDQIDLLMDRLGDMDMKPVVFGETSLQQLINWRWILILLGSLATLEWFLRKYFGGY